MRESDDDDQFWKRNRFRKRNKKVAIKHGFEGARELILAWHGLRVCASASLLGGQCYFSSPRVLHSLVLWTGMPRNLFVTLPDRHAGQGHLDGPLRPPARLCDDDGECHG